MFKFILFAVFINLSSLAIGASDDILLEAQMLRDYPTQGLMAVDIVDSETDQLFDSMLINNTIDLTTINVEDLLECADSRCDELTADPNLQEE